MNLWYNTVSIYLNVRSLTSSRGAAGTKRTYRLDVVAFPVGVDIVSEPPSFSKRYTRPRVARPYVFHQMRLMDELAEGEIHSSANKTKTQHQPRMYLEGLEKVLARRIPLPAIQDRMGRKVREPVMRFMLVIEQDLGATVRAFSKQVPEAHCAGGRNSRDDG